MALLWARRGSAVIRDINGPDAWGTAGTGCRPAFFRHTRARSTLHSIGIVVLCQLVSVGVVLHAPLARDAAVAHLDVAADGALDTGFIDTDI